MTFTLQLRLACSRILNRLGFATLTVDPAGADNAVLYTARTAGAGGEAISIAYATPTGQATTTAAVVGDAITITPGTKARMVISGAVTAGVNGTLLHARLHGGEDHWTSDGATYTGTGTQTAIVVDDIEGLMVLRTEAGSLVYSAPYSVFGTWPDEATYGSPDIGAGTPTVAAGVSSAAQVIAAVNASAPAAALVTASESGASTGPVAAVAAAFLIYPEVLTLDGIDLTLDGVTLTID